MDPSTCETYDRRNANELKTKRSWWKKIVTKDSSEYCHAFHIPQEDDKDQNNNAQSDNAFLGLCYCTQCHGNKFHDLDENSSILELREKFVRKNNIGLLKYCAVEVGGHAILKAIEIQRGLVKSDEKDKSMLNSIKELVSQGKYKEVAKAMKRLKGLPSEEWLNDVMSITFHRLEPLTVAAVLIGHAFVINGEDLKYAMINGDLDFVKGKSPKPMSTLLCLKGKWLILEPFKATAPANIFCPPVDLSKRAVFVTIENYANGKNISTASRDRADDMLTKLGYTRSVIKNPTNERISEKMEFLATTIDPSVVKTVVVLVEGHGELGALLGSDMEFIELQKIVNFFDMPEFDTIAKIFLIDCCRFVPEGEWLDYFPKMILPPNTCVAYGCQPGAECWESKLRGGVFTRCFVQATVETGSRKIKDILEKTKSLMAKKQEKYAQPQVPEIVNNLFDDDHVL